MTFASERHEGPFSPPFFVACDVQLSGSWAGARPLPRPHLARRPARARTCPRYRIEKYRQMLRSKRAAKIKALPVSPYPSAKNCRSLELELHSGAGSDKYPPGVTHSNVLHPSSCAAVAHAGSRVSQRVRGTPGDVNRQLYDGTITGLKLHLALLRPGIVMIDQ